MAVVSVAVFGLKRAKFVLLRRCGSRVPDAFILAPLVAIPAGCLDDDPGLRPDMHIYVEGKAPWFTISDELPQLDRLALQKHRAGSS